MKKALLTFLAFAALCLTAPVRPAQAQLAVDIPSASCSGVLISAQGVEMQYFFQWYDGFLTGLRIAGKAVVADYLYSHPQLILSICADTPSYSVYTMLDIAVQHAEAKLRAKH